MHRGHSPLPPSGQPPTHPHLFLGPPSFQDTPFFKFLFSYHCQCSSCHFPCSSTYSIGSYAWEHQLLTAFWCIPQPSKRSVISLHNFPRPLSLLVQMATWTYIYIDTGRWKQHVLLKQWQHCPQPNSVNHSRTKITSAVNHHKSLKSVILSNTLQK